MSWADPSGRWTDLSKPARDHSVTATLDSKYERRTIGARVALSPERRATMTLRRALITAAAVMMITAGPLAQQKTTENTGKAQTSTTTMTGEVVRVDGNNILVRMPGSQ